MDVMSKPTAEEEKDAASALVCYVRDIDKLEADTAEARIFRDGFAGELRRAGWSMQRIADHVGRSKQTVAQWLS